MTFVDTRQTTRIANQSRWRGLASMGYPEERERLREHRGKMREGRVRAFVSGSLFLLTSIGNGWVMSLS
jgi:hypothetical protein